MVLTYTSAEAKAKAKGKGSEPIRLVEAKPKAQSVERIKWKKERKRRIRRSHNPRVTLKSVAREAEPIRLRSVPPPVQGARKRASELKEALEIGTKNWHRADFRQRLLIQKVVRHRLPRGSVGESIKQKAGLDEACSSCDERTNRARLPIRRRVIRRFSGPQLKRRVEEFLERQGKARRQPAQEEEEEEDTSSDPGSRPDFDPPSSPDGGAGAAAASVTGAAAVGAAA